MALGTDFNGWGTQVRPRFGARERNESLQWYDCPSDDPATALAYPFAGLFEGSFDRQISGMVGKTSIGTRLETEGANQTVSYTFTDLAGNTTTASASGLNIDRTPPQIRFTFADLPPNANDEQHLAEFSLWHNHDVILVVEATDLVSGVAEGSPTPAVLVLTEEGASSHGTATATDRAGHTATVTSFDVKIDKTPPPDGLHRRAGFALAGINARCPGPPATDRGRPTAGPMP